MSARNPASKPHIEAVLLRVEDAGAALGVGRDVIYRLIEAGEIEAVRLALPARHASPDASEHRAAALRVVPDSLIAYRERLRAAERPKRVPARPTREPRPSRGEVIVLRS